jgi:hypothetical protein
MPNKKPAPKVKNSLPQVEQSSIILFGLVGVFCLFTFYLFTQLKSLNQQILDIDNASISARTSYFLQARDGYYMAETLSDLNNRDNFKKVLYQAPKLIDPAKAVPIKARIWGKVDSVTFTLRDGNGNVLGTAVVNGPGHNPTDTPKINTRYLNALFNVESNAELMLSKQPSTLTGTITVEENNSSDPRDVLGVASHTIEFKQATK